MEVDKASDTNGWPAQLYVRTARRLVGEYVLTQKDIQLQTEIPDSIGLGFYAIDTHIARMLVLDDGTLASEGEMTLLVSPGPWGLPYRFITPKREECTNLLVPGHSGKTGPRFGIPNMAFVKNGKVEKDASH
jgi:hypothetical protein